VIESTHLFTVTYRIGGQTAASWHVDTRRGTVKEITPAHQRDTRTYRFKAHVSANDGVLPFRVGATIVGEFTYDLKAKDEFTPKIKATGRYPSARNAFAFYLGDQRFSGTRKIAVTTGLFPYAEHFQIVAFDLKLPPEWDTDHSVGTYGIVLQNAPPRGAVTDARIPEQVELDSFVTTRELRLDFFHGVRFPGGQVDRRATVLASVDELKLVRGRSE
jgi:hypothetical protein